MKMTIDDSERYLRLMLGGMKHAVEYWKDRDKEEFDIEQTNAEAVKIALDTMRKFKKIEQIMNVGKSSNNTNIVDTWLYENISKVLSE